MENKILANGKERYSTGDEGMYQGGEVRVDEFKNGTYHFTLLDVDDGYGVAKAETFEKSFAYFPSSKGEKFAKGGNIYTDFSRFPNVGEVVDAKDIDYPMMDYFKRTNRKLLITTKDNKSFTGSVGKFYDETVLFPLGTKLSDILNVLILEDGEYAKGGMIKWQDVQVGDMARVIETNKSGVVTYAYGRKFNVTFPNGGEKTYDAKELEFIPEENLTGEIEGERRMGMEYGDGGIIEIVVVSKFPNKKHLFTDRFGFDGEMDEKEAKEQAKKDWEDESKEKHSAKKGSSIVEVLTNSEYREKYLTPKMADGGIVESKDLVSLIQEGAKNGTSKIMVEFNPAYDEKEHSSLSEELQESLKVPKVEIFDIIQEGLDVIELTSNNDVKSLKWFTDKEKFEEGGMFSMMTKYQVEKEYKRIQDELNKLRDKYGDFETEEIAKLVSQEDEIITLLYGKNFSGVGKQFYANGGIIEHGGKNIYVFKVKLGQDIDEAFRDMFIANEGRLEKKTWDNTINQLKTSLGSKFERAWKNFKSEFDIAVDRTDYVNPYYFAKGGSLKKMANGGLIESGLYLIGKPVKEGKVYAQKVAEVNPNGTVDFASDYARRITDFVYKNVKIVSSVEELMVTPQFSEGGMVTAQEREALIKSGTVMSNTFLAMNKIKSLYPKAKEIPVCAFGCYYSIYEDDKYENLIAEFEYINISKEDKIPKELEPPSSFGSYFKVIWKNKKEKGGFVRSLKEKFKRPRL